MLLVIARFFIYEHKIKKKQQFLWFFYCCRNAKFIILPEREICGLNRAIWVSVPNTTLVWKALFMTLLSGQIVRYYDSIFILV